MTLEELQTIEQERFDGETINEAKLRLEKEDFPPKKPQENALVPQNSELSEPEPFYNNDDDDFTEEDLAIQTWKICQPTSRIENVTEGCFYNGITGEETEKLEDIVFLIRKKGRVLFHKDDFSGNKRCWSNTGIAPAIDEIIALNNHDPMCELCVSKAGKQKITYCEYALWRNLKGEPDPKGKIPSPCKETVSFIGLDKTCIPFSIHFHGMGIVSVKNFMRNIFIKRQQGLIQGRKLGLRDFRFSLSLDLKMNNKGKFYVPKFDEITEITNQEERKLIYGYYSDLKAFEEKSLA